MQEQTNINFINDDSVASIVEAFALDAIDVARDNFEVKLDWSEKSIKKVEDILDRLHKSLKKASPTDDSIWTFSKIFGSYIGEVYCRNHKASWGMVTLNDESFPGLEGSNKALFWPWSKVFNRIKYGDQDNVWYYYEMITERPDMHRIYPQE
jgi:hypothetical protein